MLPVLQVTMTIVNRRFMLVHAGQPAAHAMAPPLPAATSFPRDVGNRDEERGNGMGGW